MITLLGASMSIAGLAGCDIVRRPVEEHRPVRQRARGHRPRHPPLLRHDDAVRPERLRPHRREPRRAADQDRRKPRAPLDPRRVERADPGVGARPLRSRPLANGQAERRAEVLDRFRDGLGGVVQGACRGWWRRPRGPLRVLLLPHPGATGNRVPRSLSEGDLGDLRGGQRREPARGPAVRHRARRRPHAPVRSSVCHPRPRRRPAPDRPRDDPSHARLRGRKTRGSLGWRDEPALRR